MINHYGMSIDLFKVYYKTLEAQCISELQFVRSNEPAYAINYKGTGNPSRACGANLYEKPDKKIWPACFSSKLKDPNVEEPTESPTPAHEEKQSQHEHNAKAKKTSAPPPLTIPTTQSQSGDPSITEKPVIGLPPPHPSLPQRPNIVSQVDTTRIDTSTLASRLSYHSARASISSHTRSTSLSGKESTKTSMLPSPVSDSFQSLATTNRSGSSAAQSTSGRWTESGSVTSESPTRAKMFAEQSTSRATVIYSTENGSVATAATPSSNTSTPSMDPISPVLSEATATSPPKSPKTLRSMHPQGALPASSSIRDSKGYSHYTTTSAPSGVAQNGDSGGPNNTAPQSSASNALKTTVTVSGSKVSRSTTKTASTDASGPSPKVSTFKPARNGERLTERAQEGDFLHFQRKPSPAVAPNPVNPKPVTGKRSREDEKDASNTEPDPPHSRFEPAAESSPLAPPAKRMKTIQDPGSPAQKKSTAFSSRKSTTTPHSSKTNPRQPEDQSSSNRKKIKNDGNIREEGNDSADSPISDGVKKLAGTRPAGGEVRAWLRLPFFFSHRETSGRSDRTGNYIPRPYNHGIN
jgi:hypothetical protein